MSPRWKPLPGDVPDPRRVGESLDRVAASLGVPLASTLSTVFASWPDMVGEMCVRQIDGKAVLSYFNSTTGNMEVRVADDPTLLGDAPVTTVVQHDEWPEPAETLPPPYDNRLAQPYGGYLSPGSTLDELRIFVSQSDTRARVNAPYRVIQFAVNPFKPG